MLAQTVAQNKAKVHAWSFMGESESQCIDMEGVDSFGDDCSWYYADTSTCGQYDTEEFLSNDACCACGGGEEF